MRMRPATFRARSRDMLPCLTGSWTTCILSHPPGRWRVGQEEHRQEATARETHLPTKQEKAQAEARISLEDEHSRRPQRHRRPPAKGPQAPQRLAGLPFKLTTLTAPREIRAVLRRGNRHVVHPFVVYAQDGQDACPRIAVQASRTVGNAVRRNRLRRLVKEVCRLYFSCFRRPVDLVVIARKGAADLGFQQVEQLLGGLFLRRGWCDDADR